MTKKNKCTIRPTSRYGAVLSAAVIVFGISTPLIINTGITEAAESGSQTITPIEKELALDLTSEGNLDWRHMATEPTVSAEYDSRKKLTNSLLTFEESVATGAEAQTRQTDALFSASFTDGSSGSKADAKTARATYGEGSSFTISAPAENGQERRLDLYFAVWSGVVDLEVWQGEQKIKDLSVDTGEQGAGTREQAQHLQVNYTGTSADTPLKIKGTLSKAYDPKWSNYALSAVTLHQDIQLEALKLPEEIVVPIKAPTGISYTATPENASVSGLEYLIGDPAIASIENNKLVGHKAGETTIQLKSGDVTSNKAKLVVNSLTIGPTGQSLAVPISGTTKRLFSAYDTAGDTQTKYSDVTWRTSVEKDYLRIDEKGLLTITPSTEMAPGEELTFEVIATDKNSQRSASVPVTLRFTKNLESAANPLEKNGWSLYYQDEFNNQSLDRLGWSDYYLRSWATKGDESAKANYAFEDGSVVFKIDEGVQPWSPLDGKVISSGIQSYERTGLHKFGSNRYDQARVIPTFDGSPTTKYGYFEIRAKLPDETDGSHNAWWMVGNQEDMNMFEQGADYVTNQMMEIDVNESPFSNIQNNTIVSTYHKYETDAISDVTASYDQIDPNIADIDNEFHTYGLEWTPDELIFYFDNKEFRRIKVKIDHRLTTLLGIYANSWGGDDQGIYPKEYTVDYFRIYKRPEAKGIINDIFFDENTIPQKVAVPEQGQTSDFQIKANAVDGFHQPVKEADLKWYFAADTAFKTETAVPGATIDEKTGKVTVDSSIKAGTVLRVSARSTANDRVRQSYRVFVENKEAPKATVILFDGKLTVNSISATGKTTQHKIKAAVYDQYRQQMTDAVSFELVADTPGLNKTIPQGVSITKDGQLTIDAAAKVGSVFYVQARSGDLVNNYSVQLTDAPEEPQVDSISLPFKGIKTLKKGKTLDVTPTFGPSTTGTPKITWSIDKPDLVSIDENHQLTGVKVGSTKVTAAAGGKTATFTVRVTK